MLNWIEATGKAEISMAEQRLDKIIASTGRFSRREVKTLVREGRVLVDGRIAASAEEKCDPERAHIRVNGEEIGYREHTYVMLHKPAGVLSATEDGRGKTVLDLLAPEYRKIGLFPVGRLDKDTEGLLLLTDDGALAHDLLAPKKHVDKVYFARTEGTLGEEIVDAVKILFDELIQKSEQYKNVLMPGYTHLQVAMPSSFGLWFGAYAESLADDMLFLQAAYRMTNRNPLGSAAGYGSSFPLNRTMTTQLLGFDSMDYNVVYAQMGRGKMERNVAFAMATVAGTLAKMAFDACMFNCQNFGFVKLPKECTTGSSIMPHKKNPDVFELIRAKSNKLQSLPQQVMLIMNNLPVGYFRDLQIIKEVFLPAFGELKDCLQMAAYIINKMEVNEHILDDPRYDPMFSVEEVNQLAANGTPFRDAYKKVGLEIEAGEFKPNKDIHHTHEGSIGNLCNDKIQELMENTLSEFHFERMENAEKELLGR